MQILYKCGLHLYIVDWLSHHNNTENKDHEIAGMSISIHMLSTVVDVPVCMPIKAIRNATHIDAELQMLQAYI